MLDLILKIIDRLIQLNKYRQESERKLYEDFIAPALLDLGNLHQNYLESFLRYEQMLMVDVVDGCERFGIDHPVFVKINKDSLYFAHLRSKFAIPNEFHSDSTFSDLALAFNSYIEFTSWSLPQLLAGRAENLGINRPRIIAITGLTESFSSEKPVEEKLQDAAKLLNMIVATLQSNYADIIRRNINLKTKLLDLRIG